MAFGGMEEVEALRLSEGMKPTNRVINRVSGKSEPARVVTLESGLCIAVVGRNDVYFIAGDDKRLLPR